MSSQRLLVVPPPRVCFRHLQVSSRTQNAHLPNEVLPVGLFSCEKVAVCPLERKVDVEKVLASLNTVARSAAKSFLAMKSAGQFR